MKKQIVILIVALIVFVSSTTVVLLTNRIPKGTENIPDVTTIATSEEENTKEQVIGDRTTEAITASEKITTEMVLEDINEGDELKVDGKTDSTSIKPGPSEEEIQTSSAAAATNSGNNNPQTTQASNAEGAGPNNNVPTTTEAEKVWVPPVTEMVWVVDQEAYSETYPVYETVDAIRCTNCGGLFYSGDSYTEHIDANHYDDCGGSWYADPQTIQTGTTEEHYPEEGHWEPVVIEEGYWR